MQKQKLFRNISNRNYFWLIIGLCFNHFRVFSQFQFDFPDSSTTEFNNIHIPCHVPNGREGYCVPSQQCKQTSALIKNLQKPISGDVAKYIKDSFVCKSNSKDKSKSNNEMCCPMDGIKLSNKPRSNLPTTIEEDKCTVQGGETGSCVIYSQCRPLLELLSNLIRPFPSDIPDLLQGSIMCGRETVRGISLPKVCCPKGAVKLTYEERYKVWNNTQYTSDKERYKILIM